MEVLEACSYGYLPKATAFNTSGRINDLNRSGAGWQSARSVASGPGGYEEAGAPRCPDKVSECFEWGARGPGILHGRAVQPTGR
jgi:hypothetical protein